MICVSCLCVWYDAVPGIFPFLLIRRSSGQSFSWRTGFVTLQHVGCIILQFFLPITSPLRDGAGSSLGDPVRILGSKVQDSVRISLTVGPSSSHSHVCILSFQQLKKTTAEVPLHAYTSHLCSRKYLDYILIPLAH